MTRLIPEGSDLIVPVPLHRWRLWSRGFNQAALLARSLARDTGIDCEIDLLKRARSTPSLRGLGRRARAKAVQGVFAIRPDARARLRGKAIVLVDDVYTSGATSAACTRLLLHAGASRVTILAWARVIDADVGD